METPVVTPEVVADPKQILIDAVKAQGLDIAEDAVINLAKAIFTALPAYFLATPNKMDDIAIPMLPILLPSIIKAIDKIDGKEDQVI
jgi:hypothetical protein